MFYAVIDTNVLVSALLNINSKPGLVLMSVLDGTTIPLLTSEITAEYQNVLTREKFHFPADLVKTVLSRIIVCGLFVNPLPGEYLEVTDSYDRDFYAATMSGRITADALLVTGNTRHFPHETFVVTPAQFVEMIQASKTRV